MRNIAEFQIIGRVGKVKTVGSTTRVSVCANYPVKDKQGEWQDNPHWNEVTIFHDSTQGYVNKHIDKGDLCSRAAGSARTPTTRTARPATRSISSAPTSRAWRRPPTRPASEPPGTAPGGPLPLLQEKGNELHAQAGCPTLGSRSANCVSHTLALMSTGDGGFPHCVRGQGDSKRYRVIVLRAPNSMGPPWRPFLR